MLDRITGARRPVEEWVVKRPLRLRGISGEIKGQVWESQTLLRAGRLGSLEIVLDDSSVSRRHAEVRHGDDGWAVRDLDSTNGTYVNGVRIGHGDQPLKARDIVQFGKVAVIVELTDASLDGPPSNQHVVAAAVSSFDEGIRRIAFDRNHMPRAGEQMFALLRAGHHFVNAQGEDQLLDAVLNDAVSVLEARRRSYWPRATGRNRRCGCGRWPSGRASRPAAPTTRRSSRSGASPAASRCSTAR